MTDEVSGAEPVPRRTRLLVAAAVALVAAGYVVEDRLAARETEALLAAVAACEQVVRESQASQAGLTVYQSNVLVRTDAPSGARSSAYANLASDARRWSLRLEEPLADLEALSFLPWHGPLDEGRDAYALRVQRWVQVLEDTQQRPGEPSLAPGASAVARDAAREALVEAVPQERARLTELLG